MVAALAQSGRVGATAFHVRGYPLVAHMRRAVAAGALGEVRVVHGIGTGALRRAVHEFLASSPYCTTFRESEPAAGGAGVTIAELG